jgi:PAS domain S-box-containing protein
MEASLSRSQKKLRVLDDHEYLRLLTQASQIMVWISNKQHECIYVNRPLLDFSGLSLEEALGFNWQKTIHPDDLGKSAPYLNFGSDYKSYRTEGRMRRFDGQYRWVTVLGVPLFTSLGNFNGYLGLIVDIHDQKTLGEDLRDKQKNLQKQIFKIREIAEETLLGPKNSERDLSPRGLQKLSLRELQVLKLIGEGTSTRKIAEELSVGMKTIHTYLRRIKKKLRIERLSKLRQFAAMWGSNSGDISSLGEKI